MRRATLSADAAGADAALDERTVADDLQALERLLEDLALFGQLFDSLVIRDLRVLSQPLDGEVLHSRDNDGVEVDASVQLREDAGVRSKSNSERAWWSKRPQA